MKPQHSHITPKARCLNALRLIETAGFGRASLAMTFYLNKALSFTGYRGGESIMTRRVTGHDVRFPPIAIGVTGKERDEATGYDFPIAIGIGARYYDSDLSVWLSIDPLYSKYPSQSSYSYVGNRPISVIDYDGRDEFKIDKKTGKITKVNSNRYYQDGDNIIMVKEGEEYSGEKDLTKLKKVDKLNNSEGGSRYFTAGVISATKNEKPQFFNFQNQSEAESFYCFVSESSDVEWAFAKYDFNYKGAITGIVGTDFNADMTTIPGMFEATNGEHISFISHFHPNATGRAGLPSFDIWHNGKRVGDLNNAAESPHKKIIREVYVPLDGLRYKYNSQTLYEARRLKGLGESTYIGQPIKVK